MNIDDFGPFNALLGSDYLKFLNLGSPETRQSLEVLKQAIRSSQNIKQELNQLLDANDWRPHLVAATSLAFIKPSKPVIAKVWERFDKGSWVCPQLAAALSLYDKDFKRQSIKRLISLQSKPSANKLAHQRRATSSTKIGPPSCKAISSLVGLLESCDDPEVQMLLQRPETKAGYVSDVDSSSSIASDWRTDYQRLIKEVGDT